MLWVAKSRTTTFCVIFLLCLQVLYCTLPEWLNPVGDAAFSLALWQFDCNSRGYDLVEGCDSVPAAYVASILGIVLEVFILHQTIFIADEPIGSDQTPESVAVGRAGREALAFVDQDAADFAVLAKDRTQQFEHFVIGVLSASGNSY